LEARIAAITLITSEPIFTAVLHKDLVLFSNASSQFADLLYCL